MDLTITNTVLHQADKFQNTTDAPLLQAVADANYAIVHQRDRCDVHITLHDGSLLLV